MAAVVVVVAVLVVVVVVLVVVGVVVVGDVVFVVQDAKTRDATKIKVSTWHPGNSSFHSNLLIFWNITGELTIILTSEHSEYIYV